MSLRAGTRTDVDAIRRVAKRSWETDYPEAVLTRETVEEAVNDWYAPERIEAELETESALLLVADRDRTVVGFAHATWSDETADGYILRLYVDPERRRMGIGRELLLGICTRLAEERVERINAMVLSENEPGAAFYERFGFEFVDENETGIGDRTYPESRYALHLGADGRFT